MGNSKSNHDLVLREMPQKVRELHYAVMSNDRDTVRLLIQQGVNVNFPWFNPSNPSIKDGSTPLICAVSLNHTEIVEVRMSPAIIRLCVTRVGGGVCLSVSLCGSFYLCVCVSLSLTHTHTLSVRVRPVSSLWKIISLTAIIAFCVFCS